MRTTRTKTLAAACLITVALAAGCTSDPEPSRSSEAETTTPTTTPTPTLSEEDQAAADAEAAYREWRRVVYLCMEDPPNTVSSCFDEVSIGTQRVYDYNSLAMSQADGTRSVGESKIVSIERVSVDLTDRVDRPEDPVTGLPEVRTVPTVVFDVCVDLTETDLLDASGESQIRPDFPRHRRTLVDVANYSYPDSTQWRVRDAYMKAETETCEP